MNGKRYWRSLEERQDSPEFRRWLEREFPEHASEWKGSRRTLLRLMAASFGLAGLTACRRPAERILPAGRGVEGYVPGRPLYYATIMTLGGLATGLLVETHEGRPTKVEGNPEHPSSRGAASALAQASILSLYDPDRSRTVLRDGRRADWEEFRAFAGKHFDPARLGQGEGLRFLSGAVGSPSLDYLRRHALARFPKARWVEYEPISGEEALAGAELAFGRALQPQYRFSQADVVLSLDADFLGLDCLSLSWIREFSSGRRVSSEKDTMNRLYAVESQYSLTGASADHRLRVRSGEVAWVARELAAELGLSGELRVLGNSPVRPWIAAVARDLQRQRGRCLVLAGPRQPAVVHALAFWMNQALGNFGRTLVFTQPVADPRRADLRSLAGEMTAGQVSTLVILGTNPVYNAPADAEFAAALRKVPVSVHLGLEADETAAMTNWHIPEAHYLESWGDGRALDGTASIQQPLIEPLFGGRTAAELVALITAYPHQRPYDIVRNYWTAQWPKNQAEQLWERSLHDGVIAGTAFAQVAAVVDEKRLRAAVAAMRADAGGKLELTFYSSYSTYDGRFANNGWLEEAPDPMTKLTWDNAALLAPETARRYDVQTGDMVILESARGAIQVPVLIQPGHAENAVSLALGYGRSRCGRVGRGVGHNAYPLRTSQEFWSAAVRLRKTGRRYFLVTTQEHHSMEGRPLVREATLEQYRSQPDFAHGPKKLELFSLFKEHAYTEGPQWGMVVDLNACIGCNACLLACQAENNIPIVGKQQVGRGREMHWIRLDRYFSGREDDPQVVWQPVACQQCEMAPCETVCPVAATNHSPEGLNDMTYNRCIGTRYCANNCPYKVRRFNFLDYHKGLQEVEKMVYNPDVTVRMRGVMEKCTYCVQRIEEKKIQAKAEGRRPLKDGEILTACQQTCPAEAIVFGDLMDPASRVSVLKRQNRNYALLGELNTRPRTTYLARLRNPNPELEGTGS